MAKDNNITKNQNTFAKRQREMEKKRKAQEKIKRRLERKLASESADTTNTDNDSVEQAVVDSDENLDQKSDSESTTP